MVKVQSMMAEFSIIMEISGRVIMILLAGIIFLLLFLSGLYHVWQGIWELRQGANRNAFVARCMIGGGLIVIACFAPYVVLTLGSISSVHGAP